MTRKALDSAYPPSAAQIAAAKADGYTAWFGYFKFGNDGVRNGWTDDDFRRVLAGGLATMAYCSGWASPILCRARAAALGIRICLDDESGMRPDGAWKQGWLDASGAGLYGNYWVFNVTAAFYVLAAYPTSGDPADISWWSSTPRPAGLCAWQWCGSHVEFGITVDDTWMDDGLFTFGAGSGSIGATDMAFDRQDPLVRCIIASIVGPLGAVPAAIAGMNFDAHWNLIETLAWSDITSKYGGDARIYLEKLEAVVTHGVSPASDYSAVLAQIADLKAHPSVLADPVLSAKIDALGKHLGIGAP